MDLCGDKLNVPSTGTCPQFDTMPPLAPF